MKGFTSVKILAEKGFRTHVWKHFQARNTNLILLTLFEPHSGTQKNKIEKSGIQ